MDTGDIVSFGGVAICSIVTILILLYVIYCLCDYCYIVYCYSCTNSCFSEEDDEKDSIDTNCSRHRYHSIQMEAIPEEAAEPLMSNITTAKRKLSF